MVEGIAVVRQRDAIMPSQRLLKTVAALHAAAEAARAAMSEVGHADVRIRRSSTPSSMRDEVGVEEAARMLGVGHRHTRRLAPLLDGHKSRSGQWLFPRSSVEAYVLDRQREEHQ